MLKVLSYDLCAPTPLTFLNLYAAMFNVGDQIKFLAQVREICGYVFMQYFLTFLIPF